ncbi:DUF222 domain-containing protein [Frankia sp. AiPa1]|uniref:DUF222 domain-containing protein n=1 Tax=Frankia sp. AiPa1 TaxID=573492 RepID=UPI00202B06F1|nr:DUF222 domain-containing protein [Frankia sp. AiPa1]MCL9758799.1 13E12 repeat family protein [Frankia sp. AiPa1]
MHELGSRMVAVRGHALVEARARGLAASDGAADLAGWLGDRMLLPRYEARRQVELARDTVEGPFRATGEALAQARISPGHAQVIVAGLRALPEGLAEQARVRAEAYLLEHAGLVDVNQVKKLALRMRERLTEVDCSPGGDDPERDGRTGEHGRRSRPGRARNGGEGDCAGNGADAGAGNDAGNGNGGGGLAGHGRGDEDVWRRPDPQAVRRLTFFDTAEGTMLLRGELDAEGAALLRTALDRLSAPAAEGDGVRDPRGAARRRADALVEFVRRGLSANVGPSAGGTRPHLTVVIGWDVLLGDGGEPAMTGWGLPLPREVVRRISCDAEVGRIILGPDGLPLDVGRSERIVPPHIRRALVARDRCCAFPHCDRPPSWGGASLVASVAWRRTSVDRLQAVIPLTRQATATAH